MRLGMSEGAVRVALHRGPAQARRSFTAVRHEAREKLIDGAFASDRMPGMETPPHGFLLLATLAEHRGRRGRCSSRCWARGRIS